MSRLELKTPDRDQAAVEALRQTMERRIFSTPPGLCPIELTSSFVKLCHAQTCGKCSPCRVGLEHLSIFLDDVLEGKATYETLRLLQETAQVVVDSADCALGVEAARAVLVAVKGFRDDFDEHISRGACVGNRGGSVPCVSRCPARVDIPGYVALVREGRYVDAIRLIRKDNPFPTVCAYICEHPCEFGCRRGTLDAPINIRALKKRAVDEAGDVPQPKPAQKTGKSIGVVGGGPAGLTAAYYLALMGHDVVVYEKRPKLGGMLRYGIPAYRLPRVLLDREIESILSLGVRAETGVDVGVGEYAFDKLRAKHDALFVGLGAHADKKLRIEGEDAEGVVSAVQLLRALGDGERPDFSGKKVVVVGGGNVAMDCVRSATRLGAKKTTCVYRRRQADMTALPEEIEGAIAEGVEMTTLAAPVRIETDANGAAVALYVRPQIVGLHDAAGRPRPNDAAAPEVRIPADVVIVAIGQDVESEAFGEAGVPVERWKTVVADAATQVPNMPGVFSGGDCVSGPATVIRAIAAGKTAAANIDEYLGFRNEISVDVDVPSPRFGGLGPCGRVNTVERAACERKDDFELMEIGLTEEEARQEASRCLRCDRFGMGNFKGGRERKW